jgi:outer membrane receptor protein involved in Fe transport
MRKLITFCVLFLFILQGAQANSNEIFKDGQVTGTVIDDALDAPLPYVNVIVKKTTGETVTGGITQDDGTFKVDKIPEGTYTVTIQFIGFENVDREITITRRNSKIDLGTIRLVESAEGLDEVTVIAEVSTIQQKVDRKVITIGKDLAATGTASELMVGIPSVSVDQQTGDISLRGNSNVRVMVDGKLSNIPTAQLLKQIPSTAIKSIELITNPSAKYNPEGMSGIINIVLHKNTMVGFNGNMNMGLAYEIEAKFNSSLDMNYRNGKFNFYTSYSNNISKNQNRGNIFRPENNSEQFFKFLDGRQSHLFKVGVDFYLDEKNTISVFTNQNISDSSTKGSTDALFYDNPSFDQMQIFTAENKNNSGQYNFDYKHDFDEEGHNIELEVDHNRYSGDGPVDYDDLVINDNDRVDSNDTERVRTTINLDYVKPLNETSKLEFGAQGRLFNSDINFSSTGRTINPDQDNIPNNGDEFIPRPSTNFDYTRDIYSAYAIFSKQLEKWTYQFGARLETVNVEALALSTAPDTGIVTPQEFNNDYFRVYPSAFITYTPSENNSYQFSYSRRVDRPGLGQVNPIIEWSTPLISSFGNINLEPQFTNSFEVNYTRTLNERKGTITAGVFYRAISDEINRALFIDRSDVNSGRIILTHDNFDDTSAYGVEVTSNYRPTKWWSINASFDLYSQTQKGISETLSAPIESATINDIITEVTEIENVAYNFRMFNNFRVSKSLTFTAFGFYRGKNQTLQFDIEPMYFVNAGMRYSFLEGKASFSLNYNDVFNTMEFGFDGSAPFRQVGAFNWESNTVQASISYRFGGGKYRAKSRKRRDNDEKSGSGGIF